MDQYLETHKKLKHDFNFEISCINETWGAMWDPYSPNHKTFTEPKSAELAVNETKTTVDFAAELEVPFVTVAVATHDLIGPDTATGAVEVAVETLKQMADYAKSKDIRLVFEATNHLEMGKFVNTARNHKRLIEQTGRDNIGIQLDWFHVNIEELDPYEAVMDAGDLLWHMHFRDSNSLTPGYGSTDFKAALRAAKQVGYKGYCTIECAPMVPDPDTAARHGIEYLKLVEEIVDFQLSADYPNGYAVGS
jgi:sugar phosphate isomerase/epimerase